MALTPQAISDRLEIEDVLIRYCYAVDDRDWHSYRAAFTPDAVIDDTVMPDGANQAVAVGCATYALIRHATR